MGEMNWETYTAHDGNADTVNLRQHGAVLRSRSVKREFLSVIERGDRAGRVGVEDKEGTLGGKGERKQQRGKTLK